CPTLFRSSETGPWACEQEGFDEACASVDPLAAFCADAQCVPCEDASCPDGACDPRPGRACAACRPEAEPSCPETAPFCGADLECTDACTRHEQCPESACDLGAGFCLPAAGTVAWVDGELEPSESPGGPEQCRSIPGADWRAPVTYCDLETALADAPIPAVIRMRPTDPWYRAPWTIEEQHTVVIMADPDLPDGERVRLKLGNSSDDHLLRTLASSRVYLQGLILHGAGVLGGASGVDCQGAAGQNTELWLDDVEVFLFVTGLRTNACAVHLRRVSVHDTMGRDDGTGGIGVDVTGRTV